MTVDPSALNRELTVLPRIHRRRGMFVVDVSPITVPTSGIVGIFGHSGCGKSTYVDSLWRSLRRGSIYLLRQHDSLLEHLTARQNIELGALVSPPSRATDRHVIESLSATLGILPYLDRRVTRLSGGQRRRVQFARAISANPDVLLLDEPFTGIGWRYERAARDLLASRSDAGRISVIVSHDMDVLWSVADLIVIMDDGRLVELVNPRESTLMTEDLAHVMGMPNITTIRELRDYFAVEVATLSSIPEDTDVTFGFWRDDARLVSGPRGPVDSPLLLRVLPQHTMTVTRYHLKGQIVVHVRVCDPIRNTSFHIEALTDSTASCRAANGEIAIAISAITKLVQRESDVRHRGVR